jgi:uncharacterized protein YndB with AHSA1/START domain
MDAKREREPTSAKNRTTVERKSGRELVVTRTFNAPARIVFEAWTKPDLFKRWWAPKSIGMSIVACEMDVRVGGGYRLEFRHPASEEPVAFFGRYVEVTPHSRLAWTNDEGGDGGPVTTVTFEERGGKTLLVLHELYPSKSSWTSFLSPWARGRDGDDVVDPRSVAKLEIDGRGASRECGSQSPEWTTYLRKIFSIGFPFASSSINLSR